MNRAPQSNDLTEGFDPLVPSIGVCLLVLFGCLLVWVPDVYQGILSYWMLQPLPHPFMDLEFITSSVECWGQGVDIYIHDPCDPLGQGFNYSPLWLRLPFLAIGHQRIGLLGLGLVGCFLTALGFVPRSKAPLDRALWLLAVFSYSSAYALERGNIDLFMFALATLGCLLLAGRLPARGGAYGLFLLGGLLKFYPAVLLALVLREHWVVILAVAAVAGAAFAGFVLAFHDELPRMAVNIPVTWPPGDGWGSKGLARGLNDILPQALEGLGYRADWVDALPNTHLAAFVILLGLLAAMLPMAMGLSHRADIVAAFESLPPRAARFLLMGAVLICGCFFLGQSLPYRAIFLLFALPSILALARSAPSAWARRLFGVSAGVVLFVLWQYPLRWMVPIVFGGRFDPPEGLVFLPSQGWIATYVAWAFMELSWWWVATVLMAVLFRFLATLRPAGGNIAGPSAPT